MTAPINLFPTDLNTLQRQDKEKLLGQHGRPIWMTGYSGAGKTSIAKQLASKLSEDGYLCYILDGDNIRTGINNNLSFSDEDRTENIRRIAEVSKLFVDCGIITINCFISPTKVMRELARSIIGVGDFMEVFINAPFDVCEKRDVKGLYSKARKGEIKYFTGIDSVFEPPENPDFDIRTDIMTVEESTTKLYDLILPKVKYSL
ncbi:MAG: adenylyl-sulfate kinase [Bacteroidota bacterium]